MRNAILYTTWVILTTYFISPLLLWYVFAPSERYFKDFPILDFLLFVYSSYVQALFGACIIWALLIFSIGLVQLHIPNKIIRKIVITFLVEACIYIPSLIFSDKPDLANMGVTIYAVIALISVWVYRLGEYGK